MLRRAREAGVQRFIAIADTFEEGERCLEIVQKYDDVFCTLGVHPHVAKTWEDGHLDRLKEMIASSEKVKAVGEIGLDYHYDNSPRDVQRQVFRIQLELAKELSLPAVVHCRDAVGDIKQIIEEVDPPQLVVHCCTEQWQDVSSLVDRGYFLSFTGIATYTKSEEIRRTMRQCPLERVMLETDAPYLAPIPFRGKRNEPAYMVEVAKLLAGLKGKSLEEIDAATTANTEQFFGLTK